MKISLNILSIYIKEMKGGAAGYSFRNQLRFLLLTHGLFVPALFKLALRAQTWTRRHCQCVRPDESLAMLSQICIRHDLACRDTIQIQGIIIQVNAVPAVLTTQPSDFWYISRYNSVASVMRFALAACTKLLSEPIGRVWATAGSYAGEPNRKRSVYCVISMDWRRPGRRLVL